MFEKRQVRVAAGILYGGTYGILLAGLFYNRNWTVGHAALAKDDVQQLQVLITHLAWGLISGVVFGLVFGLRPHKVSAWIGSLSFGVLGVFACRPLLYPFLHAMPDRLDAACIAMAEVMPYIGIFVGPAVENWTRRRLSDPE